MFGWIHKNGVSRPNKNKSKGQGRTCAQKNAARKRRNETSTLLELLESCISWMVNTISKTNKSSDVYHTWSFINYDI